MIFCGLNPPVNAVASGYNFSNRSNRFWPAIHLAGFTDKCLQPRDQLRLLEYGCGVTAVVQRATKRADEVSLEEFRSARHEFEATIRYYAPRSIAFLGKRALSAMVGRSDIGWGRYPMDFAEAMTWVLPNPSGLNRRFTLRALVDAYSEFRTALTELRRQDEAV